MAGQQQDLYGVEHIEPGLQGVDTLLQVVRQFYEEKMKRVIVGQTLTSEAQSTGMGSGVADAHLATFHDIITYDARNLEETITRDLLVPLVEWNFPQYRRIPLLFTIDTETDNVQQKLNAFRQAFDMGMRIRTVDIANAIGVAEAKDNEEYVVNPDIEMALMQLRAQQQAAAMGMPVQAMPQDPQQQDATQPSPQAGVQGGPREFGGPPRI
jgi:hypothetical protein